RPAAEGPMRLQGVRELHDDRDAAGCRAGGAGGRQANPDAAGGLAGLDAVQSPFGHGAEGPGNARPRLIPSVSARTDRRGWQLRGRPRREDDRTEVEQGAPDRPAGAGLESVGAGGEGQLAEEDRAVVHPGARAGAADGASDRTVTDA